jgi:hypothetical protein
MPDRQRREQQWLREVAAHAQCRTLLFAIVCNGPELVSVSNVAYFCKDNPDGGSVLLLIVDTQRH